MSATRYGVAALISPLFCGCLSIADVQPGSDASSDAIGDAGAVCKIALTDDFQSGKIENQWYTFSTPDGAVNVVEPLAEGVLKIVLPSNASSWVNGGVSSADSYDLSDCSVSVQLKDLPPAIKDTTYAGFSIELGSAADGASDAAAADGGTGDGGSARVIYADFSITGTGAGHKLNASTRTDALGSANTPRSENFVWAEHAWLRFRGSKGTLDWEVSGDGVRWNPYWSDDSGLELTRVRVVLGAGTFAPQTDPGWASFDNLNIP